MEDPPSEPIVHNVVGVVDPRFLNCIDTQLREAAEKLKLQIPDSATRFRRYDYRGINSKRFGNQPIAPSTIDTYEFKFRQVWNFFAIKGDYESMLLLLPKPPEHCPSMNANSLEEFFKFKRQPTGTPLTNIHGDVVVDIFGNQILCDGGWKTPNMSSFKAGISDLHKVHGQNGQYEEPCQACLALAPEKQHTGCEHHSGNCRIYRRGNPADSIIFTNTNRQQTIWARDDGYVEHGCSQMLPSDVRQLRNYFLSQRTIVDLQYWCCIILSILLALRHDEFHLINDASFLPNLFAITEEGIDCLVLKVRGKADKVPVTFRLHSDNDNPDFCPIRPLLVYMHLIGYKGGNLFPSADELHKRPADGIFTTTVNYGVFLKVMQNVCLQVLPKRKHFKVGTHLFRKTYYLFGVFGQAPDVDLYQCGRHSSLDNAAKYRKSALALYQLYLEKPTSENRVSIWKRTVIDNDGQDNSSVLLNQAGYLQKSLADIPDYFIFYILKIQREYGTTSDMATLIARAHTYTIKQTPDEEINDALRNVPDNVSNKIRLAFEKQFRLRLAKAQTEFQQQLSIFGRHQESTGFIRRTAKFPESSTPPAVPETATTDVTVEPPTPVVEMRHESVSLDERLQLKLMTTTMEKIQALVRIEEQRTTGSLTGPAKTFASRFLKPAINCLNNHFNGNCEEFSCAYPNFNHTTFPDLSCCGQGTVCRPKNL
jgi:hypothetical protein